MLSATVLKPVIRHTSFLLLATALLTVAGCSTKKKNLLSRGYHNLTAKYNVYWNGRESVREGIASLEKANSDNYEEILEVFPIGTAESAKSVYPQMDRGIEKASLAINKHSMLIKGKEYVSTIDDAYMLIGKSHFYKRDYVLALEMFTYVVKQYKKSPIRFDGYMWLIRTDAELARFKDGQKMMTTIEDEKSFPKKKLAELAAVKADFFIKKGDYEKAKDQLIAAIRTTKRKKNKTRYTYILAQLYQELNNNDSAAFYYAKVLRKSTPYEMEFNARINRALMASAQSGNLMAIKKELRKMAKDEKNSDYLDRIYYALGNMALADGEKDLGLEYLKRSVASSTQNMTQKAVSYYTIADLYFDKPEYELAAAYYDSSMAILPLHHKEHARVENRNSSLAELVKNIMIIRDQDSLLRLGAMTPSELDAYLDGLVEEVRTQEEQRQFEAANQPSEQQQQQQLQQNQNNGLSTTGSGWYFYNSTAISFGSNDFRQRWGDRKLEDNWRRSSKRSNALAMNNTVSGDTVQVTIDQLMDPAFYRKNIPITAAQRDSANKKVQYAFYDLGSIYKEQLSENGRAIETFEQLLKRYPRGLLNLETYYQLYRLYKAEGSTAKSQAYATRVLKEYPESEYAKILRDPEYLEKLMVLKGRLGQKYDMAFKNFNDGEYERVIEAADSALTRFKEGKILSKFALLKVMAIGATEKLPVYRAALEGYIAKYTAAPEKPKAEEQLAFVKGLMGEKLKDEKVAATDSIPVEIGYLYDPKAKHYYMMVATDLPDMSEMKGRIANFNSTMFSVEDLTIKNLKMTPTEDLIFVQGFKDTKKAMDYYNAILTDSIVFSGIDSSKTAQCIISQQNFTKFYQKKELSGYWEFFNTNYIEKEE